MAPRLAAAVLAAVGAAPDLASAAGNMNPQVRYIVSNPPLGHEDQVQVFRGEYFEVYSPPIRSQYSEVVWRTLDPVLLPEDVRRRYNESVMAITGYEVDVVRRTPQGDVSVPCYESYNHHYNSYLKGRNARVSKHKGPDMGHGPMPMFTAEGDGDVPVVAAFNEHNGNEARQSFHGYPEGYVQILEAPESFIFNPMQINLRNPDGSGKRGGPLPRSSAAPPDAPYSGLLECPCTTRTKKALNGYVAQASGQCGGHAKTQPHLHPRAVRSLRQAGGLPVATPAECFAAVAALFYGARDSSNLTVSNGDWPPGCAALAADASTYQAVFNNFTASTKVCGSAAGSAAAVGRQASLVQLGLDIREASDTVTITLTGGDGKWFGVGFGASAMADLPYAVIIDGRGAVTERRLADHGAGELLDPMVTVVSDSVEKGQRTVVLTRPLAGSTPAHFSFSAREGTLPFINAVGGAPDFGQHVARASSTLSLLEIGAPTCVCRMPGGTIDGVAYDPQCSPLPLSDLAATHNPSCDVSTYVGGIACCRDGTFLLDADQEVPAFVDEVYYKWRFYYMDYNATAHTPVFHIEWALNGCDSGGPAGIPNPCRSIEYDVPRAPPGTPPEETLHTVTSHWRVSDMMGPCNPRTDFYCADSRKVTSAGIQLIMAGGHCHAPACLGMELLNADTGELLCAVLPRRGDGDAAMDEEGYLWLPPCQWGSLEEGLKPPPVLFLDTNLTSVKWANSTYYHYGVMAIWQMRAAYAPQPAAAFV